MGSWWDDSPSGVHRPRKKKNVGGKKEWGCGFSCIVLFVAIGLGISVVTYYA